MNTLRHKKLAGVTLVEIIIALAIAVALVPVAFSTIGNQERATFDNGSKEIQGSLRLSLNNATSGLGPLPGLCPGSSCPLTTGELLFGQAAIFGGTGTSFDGNTFPLDPTGNFTKAFYTTQLKMAPVNPLTDRIIRYESWKKRELPRDIAYHYFQTNLDASINTQPVGIVFFKVNKTQTTLPVQTKIFTGSALKIFDGFGCDTGSSNCYGGTGYSPTTGIKKIRLVFKSSTNSSFVSCLKINVDANDIQEFNGADKCTGAVL